MLAERAAHGAPEKPVNEIQQALIRSAGAYVVDNGLPSETHVLVRVELRMPPRMRRF